MLEEGKMLPLKLSPMANEDNSGKKRKHEHIKRHRSKKVKRDEGGDDMEEVMPLEKRPPLKMKIRLGPQGYKIIMCTSIGGENLKLDEEPDKEESSKECLVVDETPPKEELARITFPLGRKLDTITMWEELTTPIVLPKTFSAREEDYSLLDILEEVTRDYSSRNTSIDGENLKLDEEPDKEESSKECPVVDETPPNQELARITFPLGSKLDTTTMWEEPTTPSVLPKTFSAREEDNSLLDILEEVTRYCSNSKATGDSSELIVVRRMLSPISDSGFPCTASPAVQTPPSISAANEEKKSMDEWRQDSKFLRVNGTSKAEERAGAKNQAIGSGKESKMALNSSMLPLAAVPGMSSSLLCSPQPGPSTSAALSFSALLAQKRITDRTQPSAKAKTRVNGTSKAEERAEAKNQAIGSRKESKMAPNSSTLPLAAVPGMSSALLCSPRPGPSTIAALSSSALLPQNGIIDRTLSTAAKAKSKNNRKGYKTAKQRLSKKLKLF